MMAEPKKSTKSKSKASETALEKKAAVQVLGEAGLEVAAEGVEKIVGGQGRGAGQPGRPGGRRQQCHAWAGCHAGRPAHELGWAKQ